MHHSSTPLCFKATQVTERVNQEGSALKHVHQSAMTRLMLKTIGGAPDGASMLTTVTCGGSPADWLVRIKGRLVEYSESAQEYSITYMYDTVERGQEALLAITF
jgi:hypothetical protein